MQFDDPKPGSNETCPPMGNCESDFHVEAPCDVLSLIYI
jgi:hypothetical protein